jgi:hypothetical protein
MGIPSRSWWLVIFLLLNEDSHFIDYHSPCVGWCHMVSYSLSSGLICLVSRLSQPEENEEHDISKKPLDSGLQTCQDFLLSQWYDDMNVSWSKPTWHVIKLVIPWPIPSRIDDWSPRPAAARPSARGLLCRQSAQRNLMPHRVASLERPIFKRNYIEL